MTSFTIDALVCELLKAPGWYLNEYPINAKLWIVKPGFIGCGYYGSRDGDFAVGDRCIDISEHVQALVRSKFNDVVNTPDEKLVSQLRDGLIRRWQCSLCGTFQVEMEVNGPCRSCHSRRA